MMITYKARSPFEKAVRCFLPIALVILINPFIGMLASLLLLFRMPDDWDQNEPQVYTFLIATAVWISLVNLTKQISSDQLYYAWLFEKVPQRGLYATVVGSMAEQWKDPLYGLLTWVLYYLCFGSLKMFFFVISMAIYMFHFLATYRLFRHIGASKGSLICGVIVLTFFTQYFVMTLHIIRQMLAAAIVIYAIVYRATTGKNNWWLLVSAALIHSSSLLLIVMSLIPWIYSWMNIRKIAILLAGMAIFVVYNTMIGQTIEATTNIESIQTMGYKFGDEELTDGIKISLGVLLTVLIPLGLSALFVIVRVRRKELDFYHEENISRDRALLPVCYLALLLIIFVLSFSKSSLIQYRIFYYTYSFIPLLLPLMFREQLARQVYQGGLSIFFVIRFFVLNNESTFKYASASNFIIQPFLYYFS